MRFPDKPSGAAIEDLHQERQPRHRVILAVALLVLGAIGFAVWLRERVAASALRAEAQARLDAKRRRVADLQIDRIAEAEFKALGGANEPITKENDPWGTPIRVEKSAGAVAFVRVTSAGADGRFSTPDDLVAGRHAIDSRKAGEFVGREAGRFGAGFAKGLVRGVIRQGGNETREHQTDASGR
jgi:hypothetical protein